MLIVEDGSMILGANSYADDAFAQEYFASRGKLAQWMEKTQVSEREGDLITAADFMNASFSWGSLPYDIDQTMAFPRIAWDGIPFALKQAQVLLALASRTTDLGSLMGGAPTIKKERKKLDGVGEKEFEYGDPTGYGSSLGPIPMIQGLLGPYTTGLAASSGIQSARRLRG